MYIVFEGIVGSGKSTQSKKLVEYLRNTPLRKGDVMKGQGDWDFGATNPQSSLRESSSFLQELPEVLHVREPGSTPIAEDIRHLCQAKEWEDEAMHPLTNAYLYAAARAQTLHTVVAPALARGAIVVSDRSFITSLAYQGEAQGLGFDTVLGVNDEVIRGVLPDLVLYMDIDVDTALSRTFDVAGDKWEKMGKDFFEKIVIGYKKAEKLDILAGRFQSIDARGTQEEIFDEIIAKISL